MKYIDVSEHQGVIDWEKVKDNVDGVIIRAGYGRGNADKQFVRNITECNRLGIPCGVYWFSYAYNPDMARNEAKYCLDAIKPYRVELPVAYDFEYDSVTNAQRNGIENIRFYCADAGEFMVNMAADGEKADVVFMDPPRAGSDIPFLKSVVTLSPEQSFPATSAFETIEAENFTEQSGINPLDRPYLSALPPGVCRAVGFGTLLP